MIVILRQPATPEQLLALQARHLPDRLLRLAQLTPGA